MHCGAVPFQRLPSQKRRGDPSKTPPSSHLGPLSSKTPNSSNGRGSKGQSFTNEKIISNTFVVLI